MEKADRKTAREVLKYRLTKPDHPPSGEKNRSEAVFPCGGQAERMGRSVREVGGKCFYHDPRDQLRRQLAAVMAAENFDRRLKTLGGVMPREEICKIRFSEPVRSLLVPIRQMPGSDT
ncbi:hypothetical protein [Rhodovulum sulfidophilum]|uniref:hypothetical protein n=1 Tax=Rhodovulum sulfidophilum TaxID=35806 RepID=UPI000952A3E4|nr:hypothetical protein [Rhodovulum sulfidophilum]OLS49984.1 hypothetical protein BV379_18025 [Rhodovulum sulfidophilum]